jgi:membrane glycosyltransferase
MNYLIEVLIAGLAVGYVVEFVTSLLKKWVSPSLIKLILTLPLSVVALVTFGLHDAKLFIGAPASAFVSLVILLWAAKPNEVTQVINRR